MTQLENLLKCQVVGEHPRNGNWELTVGRGFSELAVAGQPWEEAEEGPPNSAWAVGQN